MIVGMVVARMFLPHIFRTCTTFRKPKYVENNATVKPPSRECL